MLFVVEDLHYFQTNSSIHEINTRYKNHLQIPPVRLAAMQRGSIYSAIKTFNTLPTGISGHKNNNKLFKSALRKYLLTHIFYSIEEFLSNN